jgi:hypothetical protein
MFHGYYVMPDRWQRQIVWQAVDGLTAVNIPLWGGLAAHSRHCSSFVCLQFTRLNKKAFSQALLVCSLKRLVHGGKYKACYCSGLREYQTYYGSYWRKQRCIVTHLWLALTLLLLPGAGPIDSDSQISASLWLYIIMTIRTNRIGDLTRCRIFWESPLIVPLRMLSHILSIDDQNYQIQNIEVINKTGHPAYWTRHIQTLNCQPTNCSVTWFVAANDWAW